MEFFIIILVMFMYLTIFAISIGMYLLNGFGLMEMAKRSGEKYPYLGFIPYAGIYLTGKIAYGNKKGGIFYLLSQVIYAILVYAIYIVLIIIQAIVGKEMEVLFAVAGISIIILMLAVLVINFVTMYRLYRKYSDKYVAMLIFTILTCGMLSPIFIFAIRKNKILRI